MKGEIKVNAINEIKEILKRIGMNPKEISMEFLKSKGHYVDNFWSIDDIQHNYECTDEEAYTILDDIMCDERLIEIIFENIHQKAMKNNLKRKQEEE